MSCFSCCKSDDSDSKENAAGMVNMQINSKIKQEKGKHTVQILMLGPGGSGKTTVVKQIVNSAQIEEKQNEQDIFNAAQCLEDIHRMLCYDIFDLCVCNIREREKRKEFEIEDEDSRNLVDLMAKDSSIFFNRVKIGKRKASQIARIWSCNGIKKTYEYRRKQHVMDNTPYFLDKIMELYIYTGDAEEDAGDTPNSNSNKEQTDNNNNDNNSMSMRYVPQWEDYLRIRDQTTGVLTYDVPAMIQNHEWVLRLTDVGGQRSERKKWIKVFNGVHVVIYVMSLSGYDQYIYESLDVRCYDESFDVFKQVVQHNSFENTDFVVFLNKVDLFEEKLKTIPFTVYDPSVEDNSKHDPEMIIQYVQNRFEAIWLHDCPEEWREKRTLFFHSTCSLDTQMMRSVITKVNLASIKRVMRDVGMI